MRTTWTPVTDPDGSLPQTLPTSIGSGPAGVVISGGRLHGASSLLHSSDGLAWAADDTSTPVFSGVKFGGSVVGWAGGFLLAASVPAVITPPTSLGAAERRGLPLNRRHHVGQGRRAAGRGDPWLRHRGRPDRGSRRHLRRVCRRLRLVEHGRSGRDVADGACARSGFPLPRHDDCVHRHPVRRHQRRRLRWSADGRTRHPLVSTGPAISPDYSFDLLVSGDRVVLVGWQGIFPPGQPTGPTPLVLVGQLR